MVEPLALRIAGAEFDRLELHIVGHRDAEDWVSADVELVVGGFHGRYPCCLQGADFPRFLAATEQLAADLRGPAKFATCEDQVGFELRGDGRGHIECRGHAVDRCGDGNRLEWRIELDQTFLPGVLAALRRIIVAVGRP